MGCDMIVDLMQIPKQEETVNARFLPGGEPENSVYSNLIMM